MTHTFTVEHSNLKSFREPDYTLVCEISTLGDPYPKYIARCNHLYTVDVKSIVTDELVARLCRICDERVSTGWENYE